MAGPGSDLSEVPAAGCEPAALEPVAARTMPDLGRTVHRHPLTSMAGDRESYSLGYSVVRAASRPRRSPRADLDRDLRRLWEKPAPPGRLTPARVRRGFWHLRQTVTGPAGAPSPVGQDPADQKDQKQDHSAPLRTRENQPNVT